MKSTIHIQQLNGPAVDLHSGSETVIALRFWSTACPACVAGLNQLEQLSQRMESCTDVAFFSVISPGLRGEMDADTFTAWYESQGYSFPVLLDEGGALAELIGVTSYPSTALMERPSRRQRLFSGVTSEEELWQNIQDLIDTATK